MRRKISQSFIGLEIYPFRPIHDLGVLAQLIPTEMDLGLGNESRVPPKPITPWIPLS